MLLLTSNLDDYSFMSLAFIIISSIIFYYPSHDNFLVMDETLPKNDQIEIILLIHLLF